MPKNWTKYKNEFIINKYDRINLVVPKGKKAIIEAQAKKHDESVIKYINRLIDQDIEISKDTL